LRLLQTVVAVAAEKNSTLVLPFPVELLRFLERAQAGPSPAEPTALPESLSENRPEGLPESGVGRSEIGGAEASDTPET
ncbi:slipin family protein, partial [Streptomyces sp. NPDC059063]